MRRLELHVPKDRRRRIAVASLGVIGGAGLVTGALLPWVTVFAGLVGYAGVIGPNGRMLLAGGVVVILLAIRYLTRGGTGVRWTLGGVGAAMFGYAAWVLAQAVTALRASSADPMTIARLGPGLYVCTAGAALALATLFLPWPAPDGPGSVGAASRPRLTRRGLQLALGGLWLLDGALQLQPLMFGKGFITQIIQPAEAGQPAPIAAVMREAVRLVTPHLAGWDLVFALVQIVIGIGLLLPRTVKPALALSFAWAAGVWWVGEGLGGLFTGRATPLTGAPGAVLLYVLVGLLIWPVRELADRSAADGSLLCYRGGRIAWSALWGVEALLLLQPANLGPGALSAALNGSAQMAAGPLTSASASVAGLAAGHGTAITVCLAVALVGIGIGVWSPAHRTGFLLLGALAATAFWLLGQAGGMLTSGMATDPNAGPLLVLLALTLYRPGARSATAVAEPTQRGAPSGVVRV